MAQSLNRDRESAGFWINRPLAELDENLDTAGVEGISNARSCFDRFAALLSAWFPELEKAGGRISSPLTVVPEYRAYLQRTLRLDSLGTVLIKEDNRLPIAGSVKARGGFYEVLRQTEIWATGLLNGKDIYPASLSMELEKFCKNYNLVVASTGNLGLSVGLLGVRLGYQTTVFMSQEAKTWKKHLLTSQGVRVNEIQGDYTETVRQARVYAREQDQTHFVDDERSPWLFEGCGSAAFEMETQINGLDLVISPEQPLLVFLPCGVGGSSGGLAFGLRNIFGSNLHCFLVEPCNYPSVQLAIRHSESPSFFLNEMNMGGPTVADGLACASASPHALPYLKALASGALTVNDDEILNHLYQIYTLEKLKLEPSAAAGLAGLTQFLKHLHRGTSWSAREGVQWPPDSTMLVWATGGDLVPEQEHAGFRSAGQILARQQARND